MKEVLGGGCAYQPCVVSATAGRAAGRCRCLGRRIRFCASTVDKVTPPQQHLASPAREPSRQRFKEVRMQPPPVTS